VQPWSDQLRQSWPEARLLSTTLHPAVVGPGVLRVPGGGGDVCLRVGSAYRRSLWLRKSFMLLDCFSPATVKGTCWGRLLCPLA